MQAKALVSVEEYLHSSYRPDRDYVDGRVVERNLGELDHSDLQAEIVVFFRLRAKQWRVHAFPEQRVQVSATRFRVPDVCVTVGPKPTEQIFRTPPFLCIEILSPEDRSAALAERIGDYLRFGVPYVWVIDPRRQQGSIHTRAGVEEPAGGILRTVNPALAMSLPEIFAAIRE